MATYRIRRLPGGGLIVRGEVRVGKATLARARAQAVGRADIGEVTAEVQAELRRKVPRLPLVQVSAGERRGVR